MKKLLSKSLALLIILCMAFPLAAFADYVGDDYYYPGTGIPTYTSVTGQSFTSRCITEEGYLYTYYYNAGEFYPYLDKLTEYGFTYTSDVDAYGQTYYTVSKGVYSFYINLYDTELSFTFYTEGYYSPLQAQTGLYYYGTMVPAYTGRAIKTDFAIKTDYYDEQLSYVFEYYSDQYELSNYFNVLEAYGYGLLSQDIKYDSDDGYYTQYIFIFCNPNTEYFSTNDPLINKYCRPVGVLAYPDGCVSVHVLK